MKNELEMERIFSYAVALEQTGRQKNMIFFWQNIVYILNADKTVLLRFEATQDKSPEPVGFYASDYDSPIFEIEDGCIVFIQKGAEFDRRKKCRVPNQTFQEAEDLFYKFYDPDKFLYYASIQKDTLSLLNESLSHIEFVVKDKGVKIIQRDLYSGTIIELERKMVPDGFGLLTPDDVLPDILPTAGVRTSDFMALFSFNDKINLFLPNEPGYFLVEGVHNNMLGIVAGCLYDEMGYLLNLQEEKEDGRGKEQENGNSQQTPDRQNQGKITLRQRRC